jgi:hypothetical protein
VLVVDGVFQGVDDNDGVLVVDGVFVVDVIVVVFHSFIPVGGE